MDNLDKHILLQSIRLHNGLESIKRDSKNLKNSNIVTADFAIKTDNVAFKNDIIKAQNELIKNLIDIHISSQEELLKTATSMYELIIEFKKLLKDNPDIDF